VWSILTRLAGTIVAAWLTTGSVYRKASAAETGHQRHSLKLVTTPFVGRAISAPPILNASDHTVDFECGKCGMYGEHGQVHNVTIHCLACGSYNTTNE